MSNGGKTPFEIPAEMVSMAEKSFAQARAAFEQFLSAAHSTVTTVDERSRAAQAGAREVTGTIMEFAQANVASAFDYAQKLVHVNDPQTLLQLHTEYVQNQIRTLGEQARAVAEAAGKAASQMTQTKGP